MTNLSLATCSYDTPYVTLTMLRSFTIHNEPIALLLSENSKGEETAALLDIEGVPYFRTPNTSHPSGVDQILNTCGTRYVLLVDTDVLFHYSVNSLFEAFVKSGAAIGGILENRTGKDRICPWFCLIDVEAIRLRNIHYCNPEKYGPRYDVGTSFLEDIRLWGCAEYLISPTLAQQFMCHYEGMSWRHTGDESLRSLNRITYKHYFFDVLARRLDDINLAGKFTMIVKPIRRTNANIFIQLRSNNPLRLVYCKLVNLYNSWRKR